MPDGSLYIFSDTSSELFDVPTNKTLKKMPRMPGMHRTYPNTGGSVMLPQRADNHYEPEIMICGGGQTQGMGSPCEASCGRLKPMSTTPQWEMTQMPQPRGMVEGTLLLDGTVLWINGCQKGAQGFGIASDPALEALIYNPASRTWTVSGKSNIARLYHSIAMLLLDGTVLIAGSNPNEMPVTLKHVEVHNQYKAFPTEYRIEIWTPPYLRGDNANRRPTHVQLSKLELGPKSSFSITFEVKEELLSLEVILYAGGFVTHSLHMGQVMVYLVHEGLKTLEGGQKKVEVSMPEGLKLAPGPYVVYVVTNGVPGIGQFVSLGV